MRERCLDRQVDPLLEIIGAYEAEEKERISAETRAKVVNILDTARRRAHAKVLAAVTEERAITQKKALAARSRFLKELMRGQQEEVSRVLEDARSMLRDELYQVWLIADRRRVWISSALNMAADVLIEKHWEVDVAIGVSDEDLQKLRGFSAKAGAEVVAIEQSSRLLAGIKIQSASGSCPAMVDASVDGLLSDKSRIDSYLLLMLGKER